MVFNPAEFGKTLVFIGLVLIVAGVLVMGLSKLGLFQLPGDIELGGKNWRVFFPVVSCVVISVILTTIFWIIHRFKQ